MRTESNYVLWFLSTLLFNWHRNWWNDSFIRSNGLFSCFYLHFFFLSSFRRDVGSEFCQSAEYKLHPIVINIYVYNSLTVHATIDSIESNNVSRWSSRYFYFFLFVRLLSTTCFSSFKFQFIETNVCVIIRSTEYLTDWMRQTYDRPSVESQSNNLKSMNKRLNGSSVTDNNYVCTASTIVKVNVKFACCTLTVA